MKKAVEVKKAEAPKVPKVEVKNTGEMKKEEVEKSVKQLFAEALDKEDDDDSDDDDFIQTTDKATEKAKSEQVVPKASSESIANATQNATSVAQKK